MHEAHTPDERLRAALDTLAARDPDLANAYAACGLPAHRRQDPSFAGLVRIIAAQQLSNKAAASIVARLQEAETPLTPEGARELSDEDARRFGLSRPKLRYIRGIAEAVGRGELDFDRLADADDDAVLRQLTALKGVGQWTAEIFLLFALERPDVFPAQDLALQAAGQRLKGLDARPDAGTLREIAETWRPHRSAAAKFLWHLYRHPDAPV
ncbi:DNA-3-methyladenine glycosylase II [Limimonas halophila]|uniref:DNA-3-methyladenine glycosylase II n=1 Tax=Limimonas halophila TaxID=1082479 RepID=A0A1G7ST58_9PROT|nr:DNA-3-methyladenine glycosylase [Limimonas halophila]SDG26316.1 DNA-3-methyladenine glycosylase II [Limimonas halophila]